MPRPFPLPALALLAASCGASALSPQPSDPDASADASPSSDALGDASCNFATQRLLPGRGCVSATPENCDGMRCAARQICHAEFRDGGAVLVCASDGM